jgi:hypothetical protein
MGKVIGGQACLLLCFVFLPATPLEGGGQPTPGIYDKGGKYSGWVKSIDFKGVKQLTVKCNGDPPEWKNTVTDKSTIVFDMKQQDHKTVADKLSFLNSKIGHEVTITYEKDGVATEIIITSKKKEKPQ